jgi:hypothetical protein
MDADRRKFIEDSKQAKREYAKELGVKVVNTTLIMVLIVVLIVACIFCCILYSVLRASGNFF